MICQPRWALCKLCAVSGPRACRLFRSRETLSPIPHQDPEGNATAPVCNPMKGVVERRGRARAFPGPHTGQAQANTCCSHYWRGARDCGGQRGVGRGRPGKMRPRKQTAWVDNYRTLWSACRGLLRVGSLVKTRMPVQQFVLPERHACMSHQSASVSALKPDSGLGQHGG